MLSAKSDSSDNFSILSELEPNKAYILDIERNSEKLKIFAKPVTNDTFYNDLKVYKRISNLQNNIDDTLLPKCIEGADVWTDCFARYEWPEEIVTLEISTLENGKIIR